MTDLTPEYVKAALDGATPGPWRAEFEAAVEEPAIRHGETYVGTAHLGMKDWEIVADANAILIAMAPDLAREYLRLKEVEKAAGEFATYLGGDNVSLRWAREVTDRFEAFRASVEGR